MVLGRKQRLQERGQAGRWAGFSLHLLVGTWEALPTEPWLQPRGRLPARADPDPANLAPVVTVLQRSPRVESVFYEQVPLSTF